MKTVSKILIPFILILCLTISSSFRNHASNAQVLTRAGTYATYQDFNKKNLLEWDEIKFGKGKFKGTLKGQKITSTYKDATYWGGQTDDGIVYRFDKKANLPLQILTNAKVCFYVGMELSIERYDNGTVKQLNINDVEKDTKFSDIFWLSQGGDGDFIPATLDNLCTLMSSNPDLVAKIKAKGIVEQNGKDNKWFDNLTNIAGWIKEYMKTAK